MPYRPRTTTHASATRAGRSPITGAWVHDNQTGETTYTASPAAYLLDPRYRVLRGKKRPMAPSAKAEARKTAKARDQARRQAAVKVKPVLSLAQHVKRLNADPTVAMVLIHKPAEAGDREPDAAPSNRVLRVIDWLRHV